MSQSLFQDTIPIEFQTLHTYFQSIINTQQLAGIIALVYRKGKITYLDKIGWQTITSQTPVAYNSIYRIHSMTKPIVSVAALMLFEEGKFQLNDPIAQFIPKVRNLKVLTGVKHGQIEVEELHRDITFQDIFTHTAGFSYGWNPKSTLDLQYQRTMAKRGNKNLADGIDDLLDLPLAYQPGTNWKYSIATDILGRLIEIISGQSLDLFLRKQIFKPLRMRDTGFYVPKSSINRLGPIYTHKRNELRQLRSLENDPIARPPMYYSGGGGLVSTIQDYFNFCQMLLHNGKFFETQLLQQDTIQLMQRNQLADTIPALKILDAPIRGYRFGLGVAVKTGLNRQKLSLGSYFWSGVATTEFVIDPENHLLTIFLTQYMPISTQLPVIQKFYRLAYTALGL